MNDKRLQQDLQRLYGSHATALSAPPRAAALELARPADWSALGAVWRGVQSDLGLPAPAIAVNGHDGFQLWFALAEVGMAAQAAELLPALCRAYLPELRPTRLSLWSAAMATAAPALPPQRQQPVAGEQWSAFVAPDLAPVFSDEPWLDTEPGPEAQAEVLGRLVCISPAQLAAALEQLGARAGSTAPPPTPSAQPARPMAPVGLATQGADETDPRRFLLGVMNDEGVAMALRIEAAKALLSAPAKP
ncbi:hypothetical protein LNV23_01635 [Paucibacter sp. DJ1R-11]|uniref:hypothetical protein n=1 Tax=Paucibacter sp. DJ1R-11 TaxID=2893556 RepID=UPI0021E4E7BC|nr:hypothetical protein [Paucibacter sp. DJ1R-11]MCV2362147.1 hypothetical protein [Paucibacter sp. DJ1R-11]